MPSLRELQQAVRGSLLRDGAAADGWVLGAGIAAGERLGIYRNSMLGTFANALRLSFPAVHRLVGADFFEHAAHIFARAQPPHCADLNAYGARFPEFLRGFEPAARLGYLPDVAQLEWAVNRALHACDAAPLDARQLADVAAADQERVCFSAHPSITALRSEYPVDAIWRAVLQQDDGAMAAIDLGSGPVFLLVQRLADEVELVSLPAREWRFAAAILGGQALGNALAAAEGIDAPALLAHHLATGRCAGFHIEPISGDGHG